MANRWRSVTNIRLKKIPCKERMKTKKKERGILNKITLILTCANVFHFSSSSFAMIPPSSMFKCSGLIPFRIRMMAEPQSEKLYLTFQEYVQPFHFHLN